MKASLKNLAKLVAAANEEKTPAQDFLFMLNETIQRVDAEDNRPPSKSYKPSSLGNTCDRMLYFEVTGAEQDGGYADPELVGIGESGTARHENIQNAVMQMQRLGYDCEWIDPEEFVKQRGIKHLKVVERKGNEVKFYHKQLNMRFLCDGIIKLRGVYYVLEIKTETSFKWQPRTDPAYPHKVQGACYGAAFGIYRVMFLYENRDVCKKKTMVYEVTKEYVEDKVIHRIATVDQYVEDKEVPPKTENVRDCTYCDYKKICGRS